MMKKKSIISVIKSENPILWTLFILSFTVPLLLTIPMIVVQHFAQKYYKDYSLINTKGRDGIATVLDFWEDGSKVLADKHPITIKYQYFIADDSLVENRFTTYDVGLEDIKIGDKIAIRYYQDKSMLLNYSPDSKSLNPVYFPIIPWFVLIILLPSNLILYKKYLQLKNRQ